MDKLDDNNIISIEAKFPKGIPFGVPEDYFSSLETNISSRIRVNDFGDPASPFELPEDYFINLAGHIENKIYFNNLKNEKDDFDFSFFDKQKEEILNTIALQEKAGNILPYETPLNYFENLIIAIESKTSLKELPVVKKLSPYRWAYAAAAAIILCTGIVYFSNQREINVPTAQFNTDSLSTSDIVNKLEKSDIPEEELLRHIDEKQLTILENDPIQLEDKDLDILINEIDETELTGDM